MAEKDALAFLSKLGDDDELAKKVNAATPGTWDQVAREAGFDVTKEQLDAASRSVGQQLKKDANLSDEDLAKVVGGAGTLAYPTTYVNYQGMKFNVINLGKIGSVKEPAW